MDVGIYSRYTSTSTICGYDVKSTKLNWVFYKVNGLLIGFWSNFRVGCFWGWIKAARIGNRIHLLVSKFDE